MKQGVQRTRTFHMSKIFLSQKARDFHPQSADYIWLLFSAFKQQARKSARTQSLLQALNAISPDFLTAEADSTGDEANTSTTSTDHSIKYTSSHPSKNLLQLKFPCTLSFSRFYELEIMDVRHIERVHQANQRCLEYWVRCRFSCHLLGSRA